jgi:hypothetical protein
LLLVVFSSLAVAETRLGVHAGGGIDAGLISGKPHPDGVAEAGLSIEQSLSERGGLALVLERVGRMHRLEPTASEVKVDLVMRGRTGRWSGGGGLGLRRMTIEGSPDRPESKLWGADLLRLDLVCRLARVGRVEVNVYFAWTFGVYIGEIYKDRVGDMAYPTRDASTMTSAYVFGLQTAVVLPRK